MSRLKIDAAEEPQAILDRPLNWLFIGRLNFGRAKVTLVACECINTAHVWLGWGGVANEKGGRSKVKSCLMSQGESNF